MKKIILIGILLFATSNLSYSQKKDIKPTRQATELWLKEKIYKYLHKVDYYSFDDKISHKTITGNKKNISLNITDTSIIITCDVEEFTSNRYLIDGPDIKKENYSETITIPLKEISNKVFIDEGYFVIESNYNSFSRTTSYGYSSTSKWVGLKIDPYEEENFIARFNKAMNHLLTFVKKGKKSETF